jgi:hypothetical protein
VAVANATAIAVAPRRWAWAQWLRLIGPRLNGPHWTRLTRDFGPGLYGPGAGPHGTQARTGPIKKIFVLGHLAILFASIISKRQTHRKLEV